MSPFRTNGTSGPSNLPPLDETRPPTTPGLWQTSSSPEQEKAAYQAYLGRIDAAIAERQKTDAKIAQEREQAQQAAATAALQAEHARQEQAWISAGGTAADFQKAWTTTLRNEYLVAKVKAGQDQRERDVAAASAKMAASGRYAGLQNA